MNKTIPLPEIPNVFRAANVLSAMTEDAEARRDVAFACLAELIRLERSDVARALADMLRETFPDDAETAALPAEPPPSVSAGTHCFFDYEYTMPLWPSGKTAAEA